MPQVARSEHLSHDTKNAPVRDNKLLIICKIDEELWQAEWKRLLSCVAKTHRGSQFMGCLL